MTLLLETLAVVAAFSFLVWAGVKLVRSAVGMGRSAQSMLGHVQPKISFMMTQGDVAQQRVFSITSNANVLERKVSSMRIAIVRMTVIIEAFRDASERILLSLRKLGF